MLWVSIVTNVVALAALPAWAILSDRVGRKPVFIFGAIGSGALMFAYLGAIASESWPLIFISAVLMSGIVYSAMNGIQPSLYGEMFPTRVRLSGTAIGTQIGFAIGGFAPTAAAAIEGDGPNGWVPVAAYVLRLEPDRRGRRRDDDGDVQGAAGRARPQGGALPAEPRAARAHRAASGRAGARARTSGAERGLVAALVRALRTGRLIYAVAPCRSRTRPGCAAWRHLDAREGFEVVFLRAGRVEGDTAAVEEGKAWAVRYDISVDAGWATRSARVWGRASSGLRELSLEADGAGRWRVDGAPAGHLDGCLDVDLESSSLTNAFPVHRLGLEVGEAGRRARGLRPRARPRRRAPRAALHAASRTTTGASATTTSPPPSTSSASWSTTRPGSSSTTPASRSAPRELAVRLRVAAARRRGAAVRPQRLAAIVGRGDGQRRRPPRLQALRDAGGGAPGADGRLPEHRPAGGRHRQRRRAPRRRRRAARARRAGAQLRAGGRHRAHRRRPRPGACGPTSASTPPASAWRSGCARAARRSRAATTSACSRASRRSAGASSSSG